MTSNARGLLLLLTCFGCGAVDANPGSPSPQTVSVVGSWDAQFSGMVQGMGTSQTDTFVMELRQNGASVSGTLNYQGTTVQVPITGTIEGSRLTYGGKVPLGAACEASVQAEVTIDGSRLSGQQTQSTCEGTAIGRVTASRR